MRYRGCGTTLNMRQSIQGVTKDIVSGTGLESRVIEGNNPVHENHVSPVWHPSITESEKVRVNQRGPPRKAKYKLATDSARVP